MSTNGQATAPPAPADAGEAPLRRTLALARPAGGRLVLATLLGAGAIAATIGLIATSAWLISRSWQRPPESVVALAIAGVQFFALARGLCRYGERLIGHDAAFRVLANLRVTVYERLERIAPLGLPAFGGGELLARLVGDVESLQDLILRVLPAFAIALTVGTATVALVWLMLPAAAAILLVALLIAGMLVPWLTSLLAARAETRQAAARGEMTTAVVDLFEGAPELVANGAAGEQLRSSLTRDAELTRIARSGARTAGVGQGLTRLCSGLAMWGTLLVGVDAVRAGRLDGVLLAGIALIPLVAFELVAALPGATQTLQRVRRSATRVFEAIDTPPPVAEPAQPLALPPRAIELSSDGRAEHRKEGPALRARGLCASYPGREQLVLDSVDLDLGAGRRVALLGASGAGKSTLAGVLVRFLPYDEGSVTLDGIEIAALHGDAYRRVVGMVGQDAHVFATSVRENLLIAKREATDEQLMAVLAQVRLADWARRLPDELSSELGERGMRMSGGQRQRLALARGLLADFPILILDEPGEHLDVATADAILADVLAADHGGAMLLITHRLAGLEQLDEVLVLERGRVIERGTHKQLLAEGRRYAESWQRELGNELEMATDLPARTER